MDNDEKEKVRKEAKEILGTFSDALSKIEFKKKDLKAKEGGFREDGEGRKCDEDFRERMFDNSPEKDGDYILAEKKKW